MLTHEEQLLLNQAKHAIKWIIDRKHIATSDFLVAKDMYYRMHHYNHGLKVSREFKKAYVKYALECHHENQDLVRRFRL